MSLAPIGRVGTIKIIIAEFPKSGGSWFVTMLGTALDLPKRDIYVNNEFAGFDLTHHPWYEGANSYDLTESCIIKSHELPESPLHNITDKIVHLVRDGRDVVVSKYFHDKDFCVNNGISKEFTMTFSEFLEKTATEWSEYITAWSSQNVLVCSYEELLDNQIIPLNNVLNEFNLFVNEGKLKDAVASATKDKMHKSLDKAFNHNTFVRKGIAGDWRNYFSESDKFL
ncbi:sulfotransferase domain-containing protein, partial [Candidatus Nomurabacteria bacterium]|nr:sulfotransferase domain-containing protein [Candidatus Nomurabacteria bacterium]